MGRKDRTASKRGIGKQRKELERTAKGQNKGGGGRGPNVRKGEHGGGEQRGLWGFFGQYGLGTF